MSSSARARLDSSRNSMINPKLNFINNLLPNEILLQAIGLTTPIDTRNPLERQATRNRLTVKLALVCRRWSLLAIPTEYAIGSNRQARRLLKLLKKREERGTAARAIWVDSLNSVFDQSPEEVEEVEEMVTRIIKRMPNLLMVTVFGLNSTLDNNPFSQMLLRLELLRTLIVDVSVSTDFIISMLNRMPALRKLEMEWVVESEEQLDWVTVLNTTGRPHLESLKMSLELGPKVFVANLIQHLSPTLLHLDLGHSNLDSIQIILPEGLQSLKCQGDLAILRSHLPSLIKLHLHHPLNFESLHNLPALTQLGIVVDGIIRLDDLEKRLDKLKLREITIYRGRTAWRGVNFEQSCRRLKIMLALSSASF